jgi:uncharacterized protein CbrC (UPF0167 family)
MSVYRYGICAAYLLAGMNLEPTLAAKGNIRTQIIKYNTRADKIKEFIEQLNRSNDAMVLQNKIATQLVRELICRAPVWGSTSTVELNSFIRHRSTVVSF